MALEINELIMIISIVSVFVLLVAAILWYQIRSARKKSSLEDMPVHSPSSFDPGKKTKMMTKLDKRESMLRRERVLEGGTLPELAEIIIYSPRKNEKIKTPEADVRGKSAIKSIIWINNRAAFVDVDGSFIGTVPLVRGKNKLEVVAIGPYGRTLTTSISVDCVSKMAKREPVVSKAFVLPEQVTKPPTRVEEVPQVVITDEVIKERKLVGIISRAIKDDTIVVPESEIDPRVLDALREGVLSEALVTPETTETSFNDTPDDVTPERATSEEIPGIPRIPEIPKIEEDASEIPEQEVPPVPAAKKEIEEREPVLIDLGLEELEASVKMIEEVAAIKQQKEAAAEETEEEVTVSKDEIIGEDLIPRGEPISEADESSEDQVREKLETTAIEERSITPTPSDAAEEEDIELSEFEPIKQQVEGMQQLTLETIIKKLDDDRSTVIAHHTGSIQREDGELIQVLKIEKRIEKVGKKWYSTIGIVNISNTELKEIEFTEVITGTMTLTDPLPPGVAEPTTDSLLEGVKVSWLIHSIKPQKKVFITYNEKVSSLEFVPKSLQTPTVKIGK